MAKLVGKLVIEFHELEDRTWKTGLKPIMLPSGDNATDGYNTYKLALLGADLMVHINKQLGFVDTILRTKEEVAKMHNEMMSEKELKEIPDTGQTQTKLPFKEKTG